MMRKLASYQANNKSSYLTVTFDLTEEVICPLSQAKVPNMLSRKTRKKNIIILGIVQWEDSSFSPCIPSAKDTSLLEKFSGDRRKCLGPDTLIRKFQWACTSSMYGM